MCPVGAYGVLPCFLTYASNLLLIGYSVSSVMDLCLLYRMYAVLVNPYNYLKRIQSFQELIKCEPASLRQYKYDPILALDLGLDCGSIRTVVCCDILWMCIQYPSDVKRGCVTELEMT